MRKILLCILAVTLSITAQGNVRSPGSSGSSSGVTSVNTRTGAVTIVSADIPNNAANTSGNAATATALVANPTDCSANQYATAIDASGNLTCAQPSAAQITGLSKVICQSGAASNAGADTTEDTLATCTLPALGANDALRITSSWSFTTSVNAKTLRIRFGGTSTTGTAILSTAPTVNTSFTDERICRNTNSTSSQSCPPNTIQLGASSGTIIVTSLATGTAGVPIFFTGTKASAGDTLTLVGYTVELLTNGT